MCVPTAPSSVQFKHELNMSIVVPVGPLLSPPWLLFLASFRNDFNYLYNQILTAVPVKACSHGLLGLFSLALGDRETGCLEMRTSWVLRAGVWREPLCTETPELSRAPAQPPNCPCCWGHEGLGFIRAGFLFCVSH